MSELVDQEKKTLKKTRKTFGLSQTELGKMFGLSQMHISLVELGQLTFLPHQRAAIESILGPIDWDERYAKLRKEDIETTAP
jgi:predicted transcriptional regulator